MKRLIVHSLFCVLVVCIYAQPSLPGEIITPNAASLGRYGDIPVSYYTGRADISIPLYETEQRGVPLVVSLSYDTSGIPANALPSWTGHGWTLNAGGVITRKMNGVWDEYVSPDPLNDFTNYFCIHNRLSIDMQNSTNNYQILRDGVASGLYDYSPDIFYFNFMGKSGRFFFGDDGQWHVLSDDNIDVLFNVGDDNNYIYPFVRKFPDNMRLQPKTIKGFTLVDDNGNRYIFGCSTGDDTSAIEYTMPLSRTSSDEQVEPWAANAWYLTEVRDRFGNVLYTFHYERGTFLVQASTVYTWSAFYSQDSFGLFNTKVGDTYEYCNYAFPYHFCLNSPVYLRSIIMRDNDRVLFEQGWGVSMSSENFYGSLYSAGKPALLYNLERFVSYSLHGDSFYYLQTDVDSIRQYQNPNNRNNRNKKLADPLASMYFEPLARMYVESNNHQYKEYHFNYRSGASTRLYLESIGIKDAQLHSEVKDYYKFTYCKPDSLPNDYLTTATDHWGYYNGHSYHYWSLEDTEDNDMLMAQKTPDENKTKYGMLTEVQYPTGGVTCLSYSLNQFTGRMSDDRQTLIDSIGYAGGLRIQSISNYEDSTKSKLLSVRSFSYYGGQLFAKPRYHWNKWQAPTNSSTQVRISSFTDVSILPMSNSFGSHIGYSTVLEFQPGGVRNIYTYSNMSSCKDEPSFIKMSTTISPFDMYSDRDYRRGKLLSRKTCRADGTEYSSVTYQYRTDNVESNYVPISNVRFVSRDYSDPYSYWSGGVYKLFYPKYDVVQKVEKVRYGDKFVCDSTSYYKVDSHPYISLSYGHTAMYRKCISETTYRGSEHVTTNYEYPVNGTPLINQYCIPTLSTTQYINGNYVKKNSTVFSLVGGDYYVPRYELQYIVTAVTADTLIQYDAYTPTYRVSEYTDQNRCKTLLFWGGNDRLAAVVRNPLGTVAYNSSASTPKAVVTSTNSNAVFGNLPMDVKACKYNNMGLISGIAQQNGVTQYYQYDSLNRLIKIKDSNNKTLETFSYNYRQAP